MLSAASALAAITLSDPARADDAPEFDGAKRRYAIGEYEDAAQRFAVMLDPKNPPCAKGPTSGGCRLSDKDLIENARMLRGTALIGLGKGDRADQEFEAILRANPRFAPSAANFPQAVVDRFGAVKARLKPELDKLEADRLEKIRKERLAAQKAAAAAKERQDLLERLARQETVVERNSRWVALLPFGIGQIQNGDRNLGILFLATELLAGGTAIASRVIWDQTVTDLAAARNDGTATDSTYDSANSRIATAMTVNQISFTVFAGLVALGIAQAQIAFVPEKSYTRPREIKLPPPSKPSVTPTAGFGSGGASVGLVGRF